MAAEDYGQVPDLDVAGELARHMGSADLIVECLTGVFVQERHEVRERNVAIRLSQPEELHEWLGQEDFLVHEIDLENATTHAVDDRLVALSLHFVFPEVVLHVLERGQCLVHHGLDENCRAREQDKKDQDQGSCQWRGAALGDLYD